MQTWRVEAGEPHIAHDDEFELRTVVAETIGHFLAVPFAADVLLPFGWIGRTAAHHHLEQALVVVRMCPFRAQFDERIVHLGADLAGHTDDHPFTRQGRIPRLEVSHDVLSNQGHAVVRANDGGHLCPLALEALLLRHFFALSDFLEIGVDARQHRFGELELGVPGVVVDGDGGLIRHSALDVVHVDVLAEDVAGIAVGGGDRCAGEADESSVGQSITHILRQTVNFVQAILTLDIASLEAILRAVRLVHDEDDVAPVGQARVCAAIFREELLNGGEDDAPGSNAQPVAQVGTAFCLLGSLAQ